MGNICGPKKINFVKPKTFASYKFNDFNKDVFNVCIQDSHNLQSNYVTQLSPSRKDLKIESNKSQSFSFSTNGKLIPRSGSHDSNLSKESIDSGNDFNEDNYSQLSASSSGNHPNCSLPQEPMCNDQSINIKQNFEKRFKEICLEISIQVPINIQKVTWLLEDATRASLASLIDIQNSEGNTAVGIAILRNDVEFLCALLKFMPDFPEYIMVEKLKIPLVQFAAQREPINNSYNILSVILQRWIDDNSYCNVATSNISTLNSESQDLYKFILDQIRKNYQKSTQLNNLLLLFKLFLKVLPESITMQQKYPDIYNLCKNKEIFKKLNECQNKENWSELEEIFNLNNIR